MQFKEQKIIATNSAGSPEREFLSWALAQDTFTEDLKKVVLSVILNGNDSSLFVRQKALKILMGA